MRFVYRPVDRRENAYEFPAKDLADAVSKAMRWSGQGRAARWARVHGESGEVYGPNQVFGTLEALDREAQVAMGSVGDVDVDERRRGAA